LPTGVIQQRSQDLGQVLPLQTGDNVKLTEIYRFHHNWVGYGKKGSACDEASA
jgi:hypothetical protein